MKRRRRSNEQTSILEVFVDPLFGAFGAFLFIFLMVIVIMGIRLVTSDPVILTEELPPAYNAIEYNLALSAKEGMGFFKWSLAEGELPAGLRISEDGILQGRPLLPLDLGEKAIYKFRVKVDSTERAGDTKPAYRSYSLALYRDIPEEKFEIPPVQITTDSELPVVPYRTQYTLSLASVGGMPPFHWTLVSGGLPPGMQLDESGLLRGIPAPKECGCFSFSMKIQDARLAGTPGSSARKDFHLDVVAVYPPPKPLKILSTILPDGIKGQPYSAALSAEGGFPPYRWEIGGLPPGVSLDTSKNMLLGSPEEEAFFDVSLAMVDEKENFVKLDSPIRIQIRSGEIVRWWKVLAFLILYLAYLILVQIWEQSANRIRKKLQNKWDIEIILNPDGSVTVTGPERGRALISKTHALVSFCTGHSSDISTVWYTLTFQVKKVLAEICLFRLWLGFMGYALFFYVSREEVKTWPLIVSGVLLLWATLRLIAAWNGLGIRRY